ncbi:hypothetical protein KEM60_03332 [Austwickia sp. TVS 96-490-7B]|uniref:DUF6297 family protein n=1 Tax=Austwickia sp. TVS 96-490-7B TaxID=2830843 RepID=UPI001C591076|nr:DUF6297 family protein [Austwickia sp. TVS 96-490-7B]MBW3087102.1 hypothetical protein [Austwickia sp. TVS 96-490-7B]
MTASTSRADQRRRARLVQRELRWVRTSDQDIVDSAVTTWYMVALTVVLFAAMAASLLRGLGVAWGGEARESTATLVAAVFPVALVGAIWWAAAIAGPLGASSAKRTWLFAGPVDRAVLLRSRIAWMGAGAWSAGAVTTGLATAATIAEESFGGWAARTAAGAGLSMWIMAMAGWRQTVNPTSAGADRRSRFGVTLLGVTSLLAALTAAGVKLPKLVGVSTAVIAVAAVGITAAGVFSLALVARRADRLPISDIARGGDLTDAAEASAAMLDASAVWAVTTRRSLARRGRRRSRGMWTSGVMVLAVADARRVSRRWEPWLAVGGMLPWLWLLLPASASGAGLFVAGVVVVSATMPYGAGLRAWTRSTGLRRSLPGSIQRVALALLVIPMMMATALSVAVVVASHLSGWSVLLLVGAATVGVSHTAPAPDMADVGALVSTPAGAVPVGVVKRVMRGVVRPGLVLMPGLMASGPTTFLGATLGVMIAGYFVERDIAALS